MATARQQLARERGKELERRFITSYMALASIDRDVFDQMWAWDSHECVVIPGRKYRYDFRLRESIILVEIQGATYKGRKGAHSSGSGLNRDYAKARLAAANGFLLFPFSADDLRDAATQMPPLIDTVELVLSDRALEGW